MLFVNTAHPHPPFPNVRTDTAWQCASHCRLFCIWHEMHNRSIFNAVCTLLFAIGLILCDWLKSKLRYGLTIMQFYCIWHMMIDDSTMKNTRLLDREFIPKTEPWFIPYPTGHIGPYSDAIRVCQELPPLLPPRWTPSFVGLCWLHS